MRRVLLCMCLIPGATALGQSFNIDFTTTTAGAPGAGAPPATFGGAAGQPGPWNMILLGSGIPLVDTSSYLTPVTFTRTGNVTVATQETGLLTGGYEALLEDFLRGDLGAPVTLSFSNLQAGTYAVYTYAVQPASPNVSLVTMTGSTSQADQQVGGIMGSQSFFVGSTHALHVRTVAAGGTLQVVVAPPQPNMRVAIGGVQVVKLAGPRLRMHVKHNAAGAGTGSSWTDAFTHPITALTTARLAGGDNCEIWVANATYKPTTGTERYKSFDIPNHLWFYGGFGGYETSVNGRNLDLAYTFLDGEIGDAGPWDNVYTVVDASNTAADTRIDGFHIIRGYNDDAGPAGPHGAGLRLMNSSATIGNCTIAANEAFGQGGGVWSVNGAPTFIRCTIENNEGLDGSAAYHGGSGFARFYNCAFRVNAAQDGGVYFDNSDGLLAGCIFAGNIAYNDGAGVYATGAGSAVTMVNCTVAGNEATHFGGGARAENGALLYAHNSIFWDNESAQDVRADQLGADAASAIFEMFTTVQGAVGFSGENPQFVNGRGDDNHYGTWDDDLRLSAASPCIDAGMNTLIPSDGGDLDLDGDLAERLPLDFGGNLRFVDDPAKADNGFGAAPLVDRGAFEFIPPPLPGDMNCDGQVNFDDIDPFVTAMIGRAAYEAAYPGCRYWNGDISGDEQVDFDDIDPFIALLIGG